jgi:hypothetical protein
MARVKLLYVSVLVLGGSVANAGIVIEAEANGTAVNNSRATAQAIAAASFTTPVPPTVFNPPGFPTATILGAGGGPDVDFFSFSATGGAVYFDMDNIPFNFDPIVSLFDSLGNLLAYNDDSAGDPGSVHPWDAFLGVYTLPGPGTYFVTVTEFANFPSVISDTGILTRPDGAFGGFTATGTDTFGSNGVQPGLGYTLHVSLQQPAGAAADVPEPVSLAIWGIGTAAVAGMGLVRRRRKANK